MKAIDSLPPRCKETFLLSKKEGLDHNEIASYMGVSLKTVEAQIMKAYRILREKIKR
jgi:RNA polymerase sigma-70 factor (ECF subfamily)